MWDSFGRLSSLEWAPPATPDANGHWATPGSGVEDAVAVAAVVVAAAAAAAGVVAPVAVIAVD